MATRIASLLFSLLLAAVSRSAIAQESVEPLAPCGATPNPARVQYLIGYGSLMEDGSRAQTAPHAGAAQPVIVSGYQRGWYARSKGAALGTTYLGVVPDVASSLNAVMYRVDAEELKASDRRERGYCRMPVALSALKRLTAGEKPDGKAQLWIYEIPPGEASMVDEDHPLAQSYVDLFLAGCLEQEERFHLREFAAGCLRTTYGWSAHWVNDRVYPRRPFAFQPRAAEIDKLLADEVPAYWSQVRVEGALAAH
jgi:hypothetical protein